METEGISYEVLISILSILYIISLFIIYRNSTQITGTTQMINKGSVRTTDNTGFPTLEKMEVVGTRREPSGRYPKGSFRSIVLGLINYSSILRSEI